MWSTYLELHARNDDDDDDPLNAGHKFPSNLLYSFSGESSDVNSIFGPCVCLCAPQSLISPYLCD